MWAAQKGHIKCMAVLLQAGADVNEQYKYGVTPLMKAAQNNLDRSECVELLIQAGGNLNKQDQGGRTALIRAIVDCRDKCTEVLIQAGADVNTQDNRGCTALMAAAQCGYKRTLVK